MVGKMEIESELNSIQEELLYIKKNLRIIAIALVLLVCISVFIPILALITSFSPNMIIILSIIQLICITAFAVFVFRLINEGSWKVTVNLKRQEDMEKNIQKVMEEKEKELEEKEKFERLNQDLQQDL